MTNRPEFALEQALPKLMAQLGEGLIPLLRAKISRVQTDPHLGSTENHTIVIALTGKWVPDTKNALLKVIARSLAAKGFKPSDEGHAEYRLEGALAIEPIKENPTQEKLILTWVLMKQGQELGRFTQANLIDKGAASKILFDQRGLIAGGVVEGFQAILAETP